MFRSVRAALSHLTITGLAFSLVLGGLIGATTALAPTVSAFDCGSGTTGTYQWNVDRAQTGANYGYYMHAWLGYCSYSNDTNVWYNGQDSRAYWGSSYENVSQMNVNLDVYNVCSGSQIYGQGLTYYNSAYEQLKTGFLGMNGCNSLYATSSGYQQVNAKFKWSWTLQS